MPTLKRYNSSTELWELIQLSGDDILNIIQSDTEPLGTVEGRIWLDTSDSTYQGTVFEDLDVINGAFDTRITALEAQPASIPAFGAI